MIRATLITLAFAAPAHAATAPLDSASLVNGLTYISGIGFRPADDCSMRWHHHHHDSYRLRPSCTDQPYEGGKGGHLADMLPTGEGAPYTLASYAPTASQTTTPTTATRTGFGGGMSTGGGAGGTWGGDTVIVYRPEATETPSTPSPVPLPAAIWLGLGALGALGWAGKRKEGLK